MRSVLVTLVVTLFVTVVFIGAAEAAHAPRLRGAAGLAPRHKAKKPKKIKKIFRFPGDEILGALQKPTGGWITGTRRGPLPSLIEYRQSFVPEMLKASEQL